MTPLDEIAERIRCQWAVAGVSMSVVQDQQSVHSGTYGVIDVARDEPITLETLFLINSNTKLFTSMAVGLLVDRGVLGFDDLVAKHLPSLRLADPRALETLTIRHLLSHRSGVGNRGNLLWYRFSSSRQDLMERLEGLPLKDSPGARYGYQNLMFMVAGEVIASAAGCSWDEFVRDEIFRPLGMSRSRTGLGVVGGDDRLAVPHAVRDNTIRSIPLVDLDIIGSATSIYSCITDMTQWSKVLAGDGSPLVRGSTWAEMMRPLTTTKYVLNPLADPAPHSYAVGVRVAEFRDQELRFDVGAFNGMTALVAVLPRSRTSLVILANTLSHAYFLTALMYESLDAVLGLADRRWSDELFEYVCGGSPQEPSAPESPGVQDEVWPDASRCVGEYRSPLYGSVSVCIEDDQLTLSYGEWLRAPLRQIPGGRFSFDTLDWGEIPVEFEGGRDRTVDCVRLGIDETTVFQAVVDG